MTYMKKRILFLTSAIIISTLGYLHFIYHDSKLKGRVISVFDGDTITVITENKQIMHINLLGIDAPEIKQAYGFLSKQFLINLIAGRQIEIQSVGTDAHGINLATIYFHHKNINIKMIEHGYAWVYRIDGKPTDPNMCKYEQKAKNQSIGLWTQEKPIPPWIFRQKNSKQR